MGVPRHWPQHNRQLVYRDRVGRRIAGDSVIAAGKLAINALPGEGVKLRPKPPAGLAIEPGKTTEVAIPVESPPRERTVLGRVVDSTGQPIVGARVFQSGDSPARTAAETGPDGRFQLTGVIARPTFLFARKAGYHFGRRAVAVDMMPPLD